MTSVGKLNPCDGHNQRFDNALRHSHGGACRIPCPGHDNSALLFVILLHDSRQSTARQGTADARAPRRAFCFSSAPSSVLACLRAPPAPSLRRMPKSSLALIGFLQKIFTPRAVSLWQCTFNLRHILSIPGYGPGPNSSSGGQAETCGKGPRGGSLSSFNLNWGNG